MEADSFRVAKVFSNGGDIHFRLPYFQREYAWKLENWQTLWNDIVDLYAVYNDDKPPEHFMGSLVVINEGTVHGTIPAFKLVDGQQRLTTISLLLCALADLIKESQIPLYNRIRKYITNPDEIGDLHFKLLPTSKSGDRSAYLAILLGKTDENLGGSQILPAFQYFQSEISTKLKTGEMSADRLFLVIINALQVVFINLNNNERPYQIFESLNAKGKPLTQADLVRNYIAMKLPEARQPEIFENHWSKIEDLLQEKRPVGRSGFGELTAFLRHYLAYRNGVLFNEEHVYARFRDRIEADFNTPELFEQEIITLQRFSKYYNHLLRPETEANINVRDMLKRLNVMEFATGYPFLLAIYESWGRGKIQLTEFLEGLKILENYLVRRFMTGEPSNYLNKTFPSLWKDIIETEFTASLKKALVIRNYPGDYRIKQVLFTKHLYDKSSSTRQKSIQILETINRYLSEKKDAGAYTVLDGAATIEHIMPQSLGDTWQAELGENYQQIYDQYLNTLGNLTLVTSEWNSSLSNASFSNKRPKLEKHGLLLNSEYFSKDVQKWDDLAIKKRAEFLGELILEIWSALGELPAPKSAAATKPTSLTFRGETYPVISWRELAEKTTELIIQQVENFQELTVAMAGYFSLEPFQSRCRKLSNGYYLYVNLSSTQVKKYCQTLVEKSGIPSTEWKFEEKLI